MLKNRTFAWAVTLFVMVLSVFFGAYTTYGGMRSTAAAAFRAEIIPLIHEAMVPAFNMQTVAQNYLSPGEIDALAIGRTIEGIQNTDNPDRVYQYFVLLNRAVWEVHDRLIPMDISDSSRNFIINFHADFMMLDLIISQAGYNNTAREFNDALGAGLGFLVRPIVGEMPRFD